MHRRFAALVCTLLVGFTTPAWATTYQIDKDHTTVGFKIRHLFSNVQGQFNDFEGQFDYAPDKPQEWKAEAKIKATSIDTNAAQRDEHLRKPDFFDAEQFPELTFKSTEVTDVAGNTAKLHGLLAIRGVEKPVVLDLTVHGEGKDPWGNVRSGFTATTKINRKDFGLSWNKAVESGQLLVGDEVEITLEVEGIAKN